MRIPSKLKNFNCFHQTGSWLGIIAEATLPKLAMDMEEWRGGGMIAPVKIERGMQLLETEIKLGGFVLDALRSWGDPRVDGVYLRLVGAYQADDGSAPLAVECIMRGRYEEIDWGNMKAGDDTEHTLKMPLAYYKLIIDGRTEIEVDPLFFTSW